MANDLLNAFTVHDKNGKVVDYRTGQAVELAEMTQELSTIFTNVSLREHPRHVIGTVDHQGQTYFIKVSRSEGINILTQIEYQWNQRFNEQVPPTSQFRVPRAIADGYLKNGLYYIVTEKFDGQFLCPLPASTEQSNQIGPHIPALIKLTELIQGFTDIDLSARDAVFADNHTDWFLKKTDGWFNAIPDNVKETYQVEELRTIVADGAGTLEKKPRHGDFAPWHIFLMANDTYGLLDGEHAMSDGVENYDICYFIQRVHSELKNPPIAHKIFDILQTKGYDTAKLKTVLAARAIGGFLDASLSGDDYTYASQFQDWVKKL